MSKKAIDKAKKSPMGKKVSHTGNKGLTESLTNPNVMVTHKVRKAQEKRLNK
mgnify:CR=1 FL=1